MLSFLNSWIQSGEYFILPTKGHPPALWIFSLVFLDSEFPSKFLNFYNKQISAVFLQRVCNNTSFWWWFRDITCIGTSIKQMESEGVSSQLDSEGVFLVGNWHPGILGKEAPTSRMCTKSMLKTYERWKKRAPGWLGYIGDEILPSYI